MTSQADNGKSFGGKNALGHLKKKQVLGSQITEVTKAEKKNRYVSINNSGLLNKDIDFKLVPQQQKHDFK